MGRRKIEMKLVENSNSRQVTFSKRRSGLFKKANELATMCAIQLAIVVYSPGGNPYTFGHPSVEIVIERFLNQKSGHGDESSRIHKTPKMEKLNKKLDEVLKDIREEKKNGKELDSASKVRVGNLVNKPIGELTLEELKQLKISYEKLKENIKLCVDELEVAFTLLKLAKKRVFKEDFLSM